MIRRAQIILCSINLERHREEHHLDNIHTIIILYEIQILYYSTYTMMSEFDYLIDDTESIKTVSMCNETETHHNFEGNVQITDRESLIDDQ